MPIAHVLRRAGSILHLAVFFSFLYLPILMLVAYSFNANPVSMMTWKGFTFDWYLRVLANLGFTHNASTALGASDLQLYSDPNLGRSLINTLIIASSSSTLATVVGTLSALGIARTNSRLKTLLRSAIYMPIVIPDIVLGIGLLVMFSTIGFPLGRLSVILAHTVFLSSYATVVVGARLVGMDRSLEEASADLGARPLTTFRRVTLPGIAPPILAGFLLCLVISFDDLVIAYFTSGVGSTTLPIYLFGAIKRNVSPEINAVSVLMMLASLALVTVSLLVRRPSRSSGKTQEAQLPFA